MGFPTNVSLDVEFVDAFLISAETVAILPRIACGYVLYGCLRATGRAQLRAEGRVLRRTIIVLQHLQSARDVTTDWELAGIRHNSDLFENRITDKPAHHLAYKLQVVLIGIQPTSHLKIPFPDIVTHEC